jgi:arylsulfatase A-like enzyme
MIVYDPDPAADATRGRTDDRLVECIDMLPTFFEALGGDPADQDHWMEGRSILPLMRDGGAVADWRDGTFAECDYSYREARVALGLRPSQCRAWSVRTEDWKYVIFNGFPPQLFDLRDDPDELIDLGESQDHAAARAMLHERIFDWLRARRTRYTRSDAEIEATFGGARKRGILIGVW